MLAAGIIVFIIIVAGTLTLALCKAAGQADEKQDNWIEQRKKEEKQDEIEFDGYKYCDDDCYMCDFQKKCERSLMKKII